MLRSFALIMVVAVGLAACEYSWTDPADLPQRVSVCGWDWGASAEVTRTRQGAREYLGAEPIVFDPSRPGCPVGACTAADLNVLPQARRPCQQTLWAQIGLDEFVEYGMLFRL